MTTTPNGDRIRANIVTVVTALCGLALVGFPAWMVLFAIYHLPWGDGDFLSSSVLVLILGGMLIFQVFWCIFQFFYGLWVKHNYRKWIARIKAFAEKEKD